MIKKEPRNIRRTKKHGRLRNTLFGVSERPRACVFRSNRNYYVQIVNDAERKVIAGFSTLSKEFLGSCKDVKNNIARAKAFGKFVGAKAKEKSIAQIVFDRAGYKYHGRVKAIAEGMREEGLKF
jgi:large subunit ribosomal protein L18